ncbi:uncharacterized protein LOC116214722 [Punica granatum]|uniref:RING-type domain-containing protein n=2 Tax=Punica granatum TaxID=22663 RepID=A0A218VYR8_PUNGR|nr:uncharacterized protein LOC116214722 [Punica granatum]OWM65358.1 hypothetical protein CDL15_Pgr008948 [Punica granatum]PKI63161.1 hypothetical protein CRG98_016346 [Punica granatum]
MVSDSITNASIPCPNVKDLGKKKRANRSAKLKQCKLDVRREQWLSQVKKKGCGEEWTGDGLHRDASNGSSENVESRRERGRVEANGPGSIHHDSDLELSPSNSPISLNSILGSNDSGTNYSGSGSSSSSSADCCSGNITEEDDEGGDDGCLDDWEAMADALAANDERPKPPSCPPPPQDLTASNGSGMIVGGENLRSGTRATPAAANTRAWRPDDAFRPQSLPNLTKHHSFPNPSDRRFVNGGISWAGCNRIFNVPTSCPICCEDLDLTDSSFLPCLCGFRLCLFCHKRILEEDGRCPGCRKPYEHNPVEGEASVQGGGLTYRLTRSSSLMARP